MKRLSSRTLLGGLSIARSLRRGIVRPEFIIAAAMFVLLGAFLFAGLRPSADFAAKGTAKAQLIAVRAQIERYRAQNGGLVPPPAGPLGTKHLWEELTAPQGDGKPLLKAIPDLPDQYEWNWDGSKLWLTYTGSEAEISLEAESW